MRGFDIRGYGPRVVRRLYETATESSSDEVRRQRRDRRPCLLHGPGRARNSRSAATSAASASARRPSSMSARSGTSTKPDLPTSPGLCSASGRPRDTGVNETAPGDAARPVRLAPGSTGRFGAFTLRSPVGLQGILPGQQRQAAPVGRHRRQLDLAVRSASNRHRQGPPQARGRRNQIVLIQRRNPILMKKLALSLAAAVGAAHLLRPPPMRSSARDPGRRYRPHPQRVHGLQGRRDAAAERRSSRAALARQQLETSLKTEAEALEKPVQALGGKQPDAALQARVTAFRRSSSRRADRASEPPDAQIQSTQAACPAADRRQALIQIVEQSRARRQASIVVAKASDAGQRLGDRHHRRSARRAQPAAAVGQRDAAAPAAAASTTRRAGERRRRQGAAIGPLDVRRVMAALPHRYPMLLVDRVERLDPGQVDHRHQGGDDQRALLPGPFPRPADHAGRADRRGAGAGRRRARGRIARPRRTRASSSISWRSTARSSAHRRARRAADPRGRVRPEAGDGLQVRRPGAGRRQACRRGQFHGDDRRPASLSPTNRPRPSVSIAGRFLVIFSRAGWCPGRKARFPGAPNKRRARAASQ